MEARAGVLEEAIRLYRAVSTIESQKDYRVDKGEVF